MSRHRRGATWLTLVGVLSVGACHGDGPLAPPPPPPLREVVVSNPVTRTSSGVSRPAIPLAQAATAETTYVSLPPGTAPTGFTISGYTYSQAARSRLPWAMAVSTRWP